MLLVIYPYFYQDGMEGGLLALISLTLCEFTVNQLCTILWEHQPFQTFLLFQITSVISFLNYFTNRLIKYLIHSYVFLKKKNNEHSKLGSSLSTMALALGFLQFIRERRSELTTWFVNFLGFFQFFKTNLHFDEKFL